MLCHLQIRDLAIVKALEIDWSPGMTAITGETGAGKSIAIDALSLALGERAEAAMVRPGSAKAEVIATFDISHLANVRKWLAQNELSSESAQCECIIRRLVSKEGRSRAYINGIQVPLSQVRALGEMLISIHGQHAHQLLAKAEYQQQLLDQYAGHDKLLGEVKGAYKNWRELEKECEQLQKAQSERDSQKQLLEYQVQELDEFALSPGEFEQVEEEHKRLSHGHELISQSQQYLDALVESSDTTAHSIVSEAAQSFAKLAQIDESLKAVSDLLFEAAVQIEEAGSDIRHYCDRIELEPERLMEVESRLEKTISLARKHHVAPAALADHHAELAQTLAGLNHDESRLEGLMAEIQCAKEHYIGIAQKLSQSRAKAAAKLDKRITQSMRSLNMPDGIFQAKIEPPEKLQLSSSGMDKIEFLVTANPGQPLQPLNKVASGGELARISLAIQVIIANTTTTPTLIFDEVDVGISGPTAASVAMLLRTLGESTQVICVTHLPQVASKGHQQLFVEKTIADSQTQTSIRRLSEQDRIDEIARLLGGSNITATTKANASELLLN